MDKNIILSDEELEMLITSLHCMDERNYNFNARTFIPWNEAKEVKETLRVKLLKTQLSV